MNNAIARATQCTMRKPRACLLSLVVWVGCAQDADRPGSPSVDLSSDPQNCGWLGRDCLGAVCADGFCESELVGPACRDGDFSDPLPSFPCGSSNGPRGVAVRGTDVVWLFGQGGIGYSGLYRANVGVVAQPIAIVPPQDGLFGASGIVVDGDRLLHADVNRLLSLDTAWQGSLAFDGAAQWPKVSGGDAFGIGYDMAGTYSISRIDLASGGATVLYENAEPAAYSLTTFAVMEGAVYFADCSEPFACFVAKVPVIGGEPTILAESQRFIPCLDVAPGKVIWQSTPYSAAEGEVEVRSVAIDGGEVTTLAGRPGEVGGGQVLVDGSSVFVRDFAGIRRLDASDPSSPAVAVAVDDNSDESCGQMASDATHLYYFAVNGELRRVPK